MLKIDDHFLHFEVAHQVQAPKQNKLQNEQVAYYSWTLCVQRFYHHQTYGQESDPLGLYSQNTAWP